MKKKELEKQAWKQGYKDERHWHVLTRARPRFFDLVGQQTTNASIGNK